MALNLDYDFSSNRYIRDMLYEVFLLIVVQSFLSHDLLANLAVYLKNLFKKIKL